MGLLRERGATFSPLKPQPDTIVVRTTALTKRYGDCVAVDRLDLEIRAGEVFGLLGPTGSGKSTVLGMLLGLIAPTSGWMELCSHEYPSSTSDTHRIGGVVHAPSFYPGLSGRENLEALALAVGGIPPGRLAELLKLVKLEAWATRPVHTYSLGMKQRLGIAAALLTDPAIVLLDEPTTRLDPDAQRELRQLIPELARQGRAVLLASQLPSEVEQICDRAAVLQRGVAVATGWVDELPHVGTFRTEIPVQPTPESA